MAAGVQLGLDLLLWTGVDFCHQVCETKSYRTGMMPLFLCGRVAAGTSTNSSITQNLLCWGLSVASNANTYLKRAC